MGGVITITTQKRCFFHWWRYKRSIGVNNYYECHYCGARQVRPPASGGYSPVDMEWLEEATKK